MASKKSTVKKKPRSDSYPVLKGMDPISIDGRAKYYDTFELAVQSSPTSRYVTFSLPHKIESGDIEIECHIIPGDPSWPVFTANNLRTDVLRGKLPFACRIATVGPPVAKEHVYKCFIQVWARPLSSGSEKVAKLKP
jgi:hypothetical protein